MSAITGIEWCDRTWNPVTGCTKVSPGCKHCYAETIAKRLWATSYPPIPAAHADEYPNPTVRPREFTDVQTHEDRLLEPLSWRKPSKVFVNSMSDLFHEDVPDVFIDQVFAVMALAERHTFQVLTKRPQRMLAYLKSRTDADGWATREVYQSAYCVTEDNNAGADVAERGWPLPNVWLGVSVENQHFADERIPLLLQTPAAVRFISAEPLLGPVDLTDVQHSLGPGSFERGSVLDGNDGFGLSAPRTKLDWVIVGGESGPGARPFDIQWARSILAQCQAAGVACFVKQLGANAVASGIGPVGRIAGWSNRKGGDPAEWPLDLRVREFPA